MNSSSVLKLLGVFTAISFSWPALAQDPPADPADPAEEEVVEEAPALGIIFLKPPERPLLGNVSTVTTTTPLPTETDPSTPLLTVTQPSRTLPSLSTLTEEVLGSFNDPALETFLRAANFNVTQVGLTPQYRFELSGSNVNLPSNIQSSMKLNPIIFGVIDKLDFLGSITLERNFSIEEVENNSIIYNQIEITNVALEWGGIALSGSGAFIVDGRGMLNGALQLTVTSWNSDVNLDDFIQGGQATQIEILLSVLTLGDELTLPVTLEGGTAKIGQMVIGTVPSIYQ